MKKPLIILLSLIFLFLFFGDGFVYGQEVEVKKEYADLLSEADESFIEELDVAEF